MKLKNVILICALSFSTHIYSSDGVSRWRINPQGIGNILSSTSPNNGVILSLSEQGYELSLIVINSSQYCPEEDNKEAVWDTNGQLVRYIYEGCEPLDRVSLSHYRPKSKDGAAYVFQQFMDNNSVTIGKEKYSAIGFQKVLYELKERSERTVL